MRRLVLLLTILVGATICSAQLTEAEIQAHKDFLAKPVPVTTELRSIGLVGNPDFPKAKLYIMMDVIPVYQVASSGRYYILVNNNGTESRQYLGYLTANKYNNNTVFSKTDKYPYEYVIWQIDKDLKLYSIDVPTSVLNK